MPLNKFDQACSIKEDMGALCPYLFLAENIFLKFTYKNLIIMDLISYFLGGAWKKKIKVKNRKFTVKIKVTVGFSPKN